MKYDEMIGKVDALFEENKPKEAERLLLEEAETANSNGDFAYELQIQNELIGYYRQTSEKENLKKAIERAIALADGLDLDKSEEGCIPYATTLLNAANGYRSIGELSLSEKYYREVMTIYNRVLPEKDMLFAGLYNNMSLLCQEQGDFHGAMEQLQKALGIVLENNAAFEIAVTYANLANTAVLHNTKEYYEKAAEYAKEAIRRFEEMGLLDAHYSAALSALGMCLLKEGQYQKAKELFEKGMRIIESSLGKNAQYMRLKENRDMCIGKSVSGLELSREYYETYGRPMLEKQFADYVSKMTIGLVGEGSDCFGFDDLTSMDHDWGPDFCIWISDEDYERIGEELAKAYRSLPEEFMGYQRKVSKQGSGRRGVLRTSDFYNKLLGTDNYEQIDWRSVPDYALAAAVNGVLFSANDSSFVHMREKLQAGYPENILYLKLADDLAKISQTGQYNYARMLKRGDRMTADMMLSDCIRQILVLIHHMNGLYPPHDKWLHRSFEKLMGESKLAALLGKLHGAFSMKDNEALLHVTQTMEQIGDAIARELYARDYISDIETYLDYHTDELVRKSAYAVLSDEELVNRITKIEFEAFDKVKNEGGRAYCQNDWPTFSVMRKSQYLTWNRTMLLQYLYDFTREYERGHNLITEKYGRMMESTAPEEYKELEKHFEVLSEEKKAVIAQIVSLQMDMLHEFGKEYPKVAGNARSFHTYEDNYVNTSYETYLRGEISTYSDKMLQLYGRYVIACVNSGRNIAEETIQNTARLYGYANLDAFEKSI